MRTKTDASHGKTRKRDSRDLGTGMNSFYGGSGEPLPPAEAKTTSREKLRRMPKRHRDLVFLRMDGYFSRNLAQLHTIFVVALAIMMIGFGVLAWAMFLSIHQATALTFALAGAGVMTEFVGLTLTMIYRSTLKQAENFVQILERINSISVARAILDNVPEREIPVRADLRMEMAKILLENGRAVPRQVRNSETQGAPAHRIASK